MKYARFLKKNGTIGFIAPSFGCATEPYKTAFSHAIQRFKTIGYQIELGANCYKSEGIGISNSPKLCGEEFMQAYCESKSDILLSCGGGELMCEDLDYIDFEKIKKAEPKWFMGYSDNTNLTFLLPTLCDTASVYGPNAPAFGMESWHSSIADAFSILTGEKREVSGYEMWERESLKSEENPLAPYHVTEKRQIKSFLNENVQFQGRLIGGCMDSLVILLGTKFDKVNEFVEKYKDDGIIWFLESCDLNVMSIRRAMWQMEHSGWFRYTKGFLIGRPLQFGTTMMGLDQYEAVLGVIRHYHVPILMDIDLGHLPPMMPIVCGAMASVEMKDGNVFLHYDYR